MLTNINPHSLTSLHNHTIFCDGENDVETMCRAAFEKGLAAVGFSSHAPIEKTGLESNWNMKTERLGEYIDQVHAARRRWEGKIAVYLGVEVDYVKGLRSARDGDIQGLGLDYAIGSVHYLVPPRGAPFAVDGPAEELERAAEPPADKPVKADKNGQQEIWDFGEGYHDDCI